MAKIRKGSSEADDRFNVRMLLWEFSKQVADEEPAPTPQGMFIELMNGDSLTGESKTRIERVIQLFRGLKEYQVLISTRIRQESKFADSEMYMLTTEALMLTLLDMSRQLNECLAQYAVIPQIQPLWPVPLHYFLPAHAANRSPAERGEAGAVLSAVLLAQRNQLQDVRKCLCGKYFLAGRIDQNYCSVKCRVKAHQSSEEFKDKRRKADRARYRQHRDGRVKESTRRNHGTKKTR